jgi:hypothetical protein
MGREGQRSVVTTPLSLQPQWMTPVPSELECLQAQSVAYSIYRQNYLGSTHYGSYIVESWMNNEVEVILERCGPGLIGVPPFARDKEPTGYSLLPM